MIRYAEAYLAQGKMIKWGLIVLEGEVEDGETVLEVTRMLNGATQCALTSAIRHALFSWLFNTTKWASCVEGPSDAAGDYVADASLAIPLRLCGLLVFLQLMRWIMGRKHALRVSLHRRMME